jgi:hypothetical protein
MRYFTAHTPGHLTAAGGANPSQGIAEEGIGTAASLKDTPISTLSHHLHSLRNGGKGSLNLEGWAFTGKRQGMQSSNDQDSLQYYGALLCSQSLRSFSNGGNSWGLRGYLRSPQKEWMVMVRMSKIRGTFRLISLQRGIELIPDTKNLSLF